MSAGTDYNSNPGSNSGNNFYNPNSGPGSGNQGGGNSGYDGGNYGGNYSGNTTNEGTILFSILKEVIYGSSGNSGRPNPFVGLNFKPTAILSATPSRTPFKQLSKPVGTGASNVYSGGGKKSQGNSNSSWINGAQYGIPVWGSCLQSSDALNNGDYLNAACFFGLGFFEMFTLGEGTEVRLGMNAAKTSTSIIEETAVHGNSLKSLKPTWGYKLFSEDGTFLKNGITSKLVPETRYTKAFMLDKKMIPFKQFPNRLEAWQWKFQQNQILRGPLNLNMH